MCFFMIIGIKTIIISIQSFDSLKNVFELCLSKYASTHLCDNKTVNVLIMSCFYFGCTTLIYINIVLSTQYFKILNEINFQPCFYIRSGCENIFCDRYLYRRHTSGYWDHLSGFCILFQEIVDVMCRIILTT